MFDTAFEIGSEIKGPDTESEISAMKGMDNKSQLAYIEKRLRTIGSEIMGNKYGRDEKVNSAITFLKEKQEELEDLSR